MPDATLPTTVEELTITQIGNELEAVVDSEERIKLLLSFQNVEHLSSAALGMLIQLHHKVEEGNGRLILAEIIPSIFEVFKITRLNKLFEIYATSEEALKKF